MATRREWVNPVEYMQHMGFPEVAEWVTFDPGVDYQYRIIRQQSHDGLVAFTDELLRRALMPLVERTSYYKPHGAPVKPPHYIVGWLRLAVAYGKVDLPCGRYFGQRERITIPIRVVESGRLVSAFYLRDTGGTLHRLGYE